MTASSAASTPPTTSAQDLAKDKENPIGEGEQDDSIRTNSTASSALTASKKGVHFHGVSIRYFARLLGDNPAAQDGPPLGLDWKYMDLTRDEIDSSSDKNKNTNSNNNRDSSGVETESNNSSSTSSSSSSSSFFPHDVIPIDEFEQEANRRRNRRLMEVFKLQEKSQRQIKKMEQTLMKRASTGNVFIYLKEKDEKEDPDNFIPEEQIKQLSAKWLKIQPVPGKKREKILLLQTETTKAEIEKLKRELLKIRNSRKTTIAMAETGIDDWVKLFEFIKRRFRRFRTGISKEKEQELLWEQAQEYFETMERESFHHSHTTSTVATKKDPADVMPREDFSTVSLRTTFSHEVAPLGNATAT